jgi:hypothetical protein
MLAYDIWMSRVEKEQDDVLRQFIPVIARLSAFNILFYDST